MLQVSHCYKEDLKDYPHQLCTLLKRHSTQLDPEMRVVSWLLGEGCGCLFDRPMCNKISWIDCFPISEDYLDICSPVAQLRYPYYSGADPGHAELVG